MLTIGERFKRYEFVTQRYALRRTPLIVRVDGKAFHTFTKHCKRPFDSQLMEAMVNSAIEVSRQMQGFKIAYVQSDEVTFCLADYDTLNTEAWFGYRLNKIESVTASYMSVFFNKLYGSYENPVVFDARAFNIPHNEVVNCLLWRAMDWKKNSLQMYCRHFFSNKQLKGKKQCDMHQMLYDIGKNWATDLNDMEKNGTFFRYNTFGKLQKYYVKPSYDSISKIVGNLFEYPK